MKPLEGQLDATNLRFGVVVGKFNDFVTDRLLAGALDALGKAGAAESAIQVAKVPGAFEIPLVARRMARSGRFDAVICLGAVIRGETPHFDYISAEASRGIAQAAWESDLPVVFGVLTTNTVEQALERAGSAERNRGAEAARTAVEMANLMKKLKGTTGKLTSRGRSRARQRP
ncbi:MAG: 6,7-dimethyl-8-ribityllumazine synthase [Nitrospiraceae bacterium]